ncbi:hypothetical protein INS49_011733 [Diaporthe citri]|uniref:uncharacterized protein n=1 Tax=Diaporthe citri TaxID=83186 RepID=UPI001C7FCDA7|nr:uncharacterized protein INS49_011733 [Diaporthe citri]KAG6360668.1 hypothetical protein INS49_011733 [Diaporthe citri]
MHQTVVAALANRGPHTAVTAPSPSPSPSSVDGKLIVDIQNHPISFTTDPTPAQLPYIKAYINANPVIFKARVHDSKILEHPPKLVQHFTFLVNILINRGDKISNELNTHILTSSPSLHWAAEIYHYVLPVVVTWLESGETPQNLHAIEVQELSASFSVYLCLAGDDFYGGSGTRLGSSPSSSGGLARQNDRNTSRNSTNTLLAIIKEAKKQDKPVQWAQASKLEILVPKIVDGVHKMVPITELDDVQELLHFRVLTILAEVLLTMCTSGHKADYWNFPIWSTNPSWKGACSRPAWAETITGVSTPELRNAKRLVENLSPEQHEKNKARARVENLSTEQHERKKASQRVENLSTEVYDRKKARDRVENMSTEQHDRKKAGNRVENLSTEQHDKVKDRRRINNLSTEQHEKKNASQRVENMRTEQHDKVKDRHRIDNLSMEQHEKKNASQRVENMSTEQHERLKARRRERYARKKAARLAAQTKPLGELSASEINTKKSTT